MRDVALLWLALIGLISVAYGKPRFWQEGRVSSHKTLPVSGRSPNHEHLYGVTSGGLRYMIVLDRPLQVKVEDKVRFAQDRKQIRLLDSNGQERKGALVEIVSVAGGRR